MKSIAAKLEQLNGLLGTRDISPWEQGFIERVHAQVKARDGDTRSLSEGQVDKIEQIWERHFAG